MPIKKSAQKASSSSEKKRVINLKFKNDLKIQLNIFEKKIEKKKQISQADLDTVYSVVDKALKKKILHKNTAARKKSRYASMFNKYM